MNKQTIIGFALGTIFTLVATIITMFVQEFFNTRRDKKERKYRLVDNVYGERVNAYMELYEKLLILMDTLKEKGKNETDIDEVIDDVYLTLYKKAIFLSMNSILMLKMILIPFKGMVFMKHIKEITSAEGIKETSEESEKKFVEIKMREYKGIENYLIHIKKELGLDEIEKNFSK